VIDENDDKLSQEVLALPRELEPPRNLWVGIEARIEAKRRRTLVVRRSVTGASMLLAAAAVLLSIRFAGRPATDPRQANRSAPLIASEAPVVAPPQVTHEPPPAMLVPEEASYRTALAALESTLHDRQKELPEKDAAKVGASLHAIDVAISTTRSSLAQHPDDTDLRAELDAEYEQKIDAMNDVLEWTTRS
jgi:hypothetical protein